MNKNVLRNGELIAEASAKRESRLKESKRQIIIFVVSSLIFLFIFKFIFIIGVVPTESMVPTIQKNTVVISNSLAYRNKPIQRGDIINFYFDGNLLIKRVIAIGGDEVEIKNGNVYVNGEITEVYNDALVDYTLYECNIVIPEDCCYVLGDNRGNSLDSREYGCIPYKDVKAKALININFGKLKIKKL